MRMKPCLTPDDVLQIAAACRAHGQIIKREPTIAIVDAGGHLLYMERPERNPVNSVEMASLKAATAALRGRPSGAFAQRVAEKPGFLMMPGCLGVEGGIPLIYQGECIGGVGVSGIDKDDEPVAIAGAKVFNAD